MRVHIDVAGDGDARTVTVACSGDDGSIPTQVGTHDLDILRVVSADGDACEIPHRAGSAMDGAGLAAVIGRIEDRELQTDDVVLVGQHLFDVLLAPAWDQVVEGVTGGEPIILGLRWTRTDTVMSAMPWEAMHDGHTFLAVRPGNLIAMVRVVADSDAEPLSVVGEVPRVLFAVGSSIDDPEIRAGAELMGLLLDFEREPPDSSPTRGWVESRLVASVTQQELGSAVHDFKPHCVHIVAHGDQDPTTGEAALVLSGVAYTAGQLAAHLRWSESFGGGDRLPGLVVLSACDVGQDGQSMAGSKYSVPLAARLIAEGVPTAVGMAGEVSDAACRLFTRRFGNSLLEGENIAVGAAHGRRAAYANSETGPPTTSIDWARPTVFMSDAVPLGHTPVSPANSFADLRALSGALNVSVDRTQPVFCGRDEFFAHLDDLVDGRARVLVAWAKDLDGMGEKRLLREIGRRALHRGMLPIDVEDNPIEKPPTNITGLAVDIARNIFGVADNLGLPPFQSQLVEELDSGLAGSTPSWTSLIGKTAGLRDHEPLHPAQLRGMLSVDLRSLLAAARAKYPQVFLPERSAMVFLHRVHRLDNVIDQLFTKDTHGFIGPHGLGTIDNPVPVVMSTETPPRIDGAKNDRPAGWSWEQLRPLLRRGNLDQTDELVYAYYLWVLMNPRPGMFELPNGTRLGDSVYAPLRGHDQWRAQFAKRFSGHVDDFNNDVLYAIADYLSDDEKFSRGDDESVFETYWAGQR